MNVEREYRRYIKMRAMNSPLGEKLQSVRKKSPV